MLSSRRLRLSRDRFLLRPRDDALVASLLASTPSLMSLLEMAAAAVVRKVRTAIVAFLATVSLVAAHLTASPLKMVSSPTRSGIVLTPKPKSFSAAFLRLLI